jgi:plasmid stabilization system protein ParE
LDSIARFIAERDRWAAEKVVRRIVGAAGKLEMQPMMGRPGRIAGTREFVVSGLPYIIVYQVSEQWIDILTVFHTAQSGPDIV